MKLVINACYGGFSLSLEAIKRYFEIKGQPIWVEESKEFTSLGVFTVWLVPPEERIKEKEGEEFYKMTVEERIAYNKQYSKLTWYYRDIDRSDPILVQVVEELGEAANGRCAELSVVDIPDDVNWTIEEYDGNEHVAEVHRTWR